MCCYFNIYADGLARPQRTLRAAPMIDAFVRRGPKAVLCCGFFGQGVLPTRGGSDRSRVGNPAWLYRDSRPPSVRYPLCLALKLDISDSLHRSGRIVRQSH